LTAVDKKEANVADNSSSGEEISDATRSLLGELTGVETRVSFY
jgi:hypothetical protein